MRLLFCICQDETDLVNQSGIRQGNIAHDLRGNDAARIGRIFSPSKRFGTFSFPICLNTQVRVES